MFGLQSLRNGVSSLSHGVTKIATAAAVTAGGVLFGASTEVNAASADAKKETNTNPSEIDRSLLQLRDALRTASLTLITTTIVSHKVGLYVGSVAPREARGTIATLTGSTLSAAVTLGAFALLSTAVPVSATFVTIITAVNVLIGGGAAEHAATCPRLAAQRGERVAVAAAHEHVN